jgi:ABC-type glycerol-3-phosphate transport system substrate-binding protein
VAQGTVAVIPSGAKNKEASGKLLAWMMTPDILAEEMIANFNLPTTRKAAENPGFHENKKFEVFLNLMADPNAVNNIVSPIGAEVSTELGQIEEQVLHAGADPEPLLKAAEEKLQPMLDKALGK